MVNKLFHRKFNELEEFKSSPAFPLYAGGPVNTDKLFFIHRRPDLIEGGTLISGSFYSGGNFKQAVMLINSKQISEHDIRLFIGYCGWDDVELEEEIKEGSWLAAGCFQEHIFAMDEASRWNYIFTEISAHR